MANFLKRKERQERWFSYRKKLNRAQGSLENQDVDLYTDKNWVNFRKQSFYWSLGGLGILLIIGFMMWGASRADVAVTRAVGGFVESPSPGASGAVPGASGASGGGAGQSGEGFAWVGFEEKDAVLAGVWQEREFVSINGDTFTGSFRPEWAAKSHQHTKLLQQRYPNYSSFIKTWKVGELEDGTDVMFMAPTPLFPQGYSFLIKFQNGSFEENAYEVLFHSYIQGFDDNFPWQGSDEYWVGFKNVQVEGSGELRKVDQVSDPDEFFLMSPSNLRIFTMEGSSISNEEEFARMQGISDFLRQGKSFAKSWELVVEHDSEAGPWESVYLVQTNGVVARTS